MDLLTGDWHLDSSPDNEYRWSVFESVFKVAHEHGIKRIFVLGDMFDRKDRHNAEFVNRVISTLAAYPVYWYILRGNHDATMHDPSFWQFLNITQLDVEYITKPYAVDDILCLPWSPDPIKEWADIDYSKYKSIFLHITAAGALAENGQKMAGTKIPQLPTNIPLYSGDIHTPQKIRNLVHVGAPHPVKFGDTYKCRFLLIDEDYQIEKEIELSPPRKHMIEISSIEELEQLKVSGGDVAKIRFKLSTNQIEKWGEIEAKLAAWSQYNKIDIASTEVIVQYSAQPNENYDLTPGQLLHEFAESEGISKELLVTGLKLLRTARQ